MHWIFYFPHVNNFLSFYGHQYDSYFITTSPTPTPHAPSPQAALHFSITSKNVFHSYIISYPPPRFPPYQDHPSKSSTQPLSHHHTHSSTTPFPMLPPFRDHPRHSLSLSHPSPIISSISPLFKSCFFPSTQLRTTTRPLPLVKVSHSLSHTLSPAPPRLVCTHPPRPAPEPAPVWTHPAPASGTPKLTRFQRDFSLPFPGRVLRLRATIML